MASYATINFELIRNDYWEETLEVNYEGSDNLPVDFTSAASALCQVRTSPGVLPVVSFSSTVGEIDFTVPGRIKLYKSNADTNIEPGNYSYDIEFVYGGKPKTQVKGTITILDDITRQ